MTLEELEKLVLTQEEKIKNLEGTIENLTSLVSDLNTSVEGIKSSLDSYKPQDLQPLLDQIGSLNTKLNKLSGSGSETTNTIVRTKPETPKDIFSLSDDKNGIEVYDGIDEQRKPKYKVLKAIKFKFKSPLIELDGIKYTTAELAEQKNNKFLKEDIIRKLIKRGSGGIELYQ